jgi:hypothetical protein
VSGPELGPNELCLECVSRQLHGLESAGNAEDLRSQAQELILKVGGDQGGRGRQRGRAAGRRCLRHSRRLPVRPPTPLHSSHPTPPCFPVPCLLFACSRGIAPSLQRFPCAARPSLCLTHPQTPPPRPCPQADAKGQEAILDEGDAYWVSKTWLQGELWPWL